MFLRLMIVLVVSILVSSCSTKREVLSYIYDSAINSSINSIVSDRKNSVLNGVDMSVLEGRIVLNEIEYDTDTPIDSITGKPVVKTERKVEVSFNGTSSSDIKIDTNIQKDSISNETETENVSVVLDENKERESVSWLSELKSVGIVFLLLTVFVLIYRIISRYYHSN